MTKRERRVEPATMTAGGIIRAAAEILRKIFRKKPKAARKA